MRDELCRWTGRYLDATLAYFTCFRDPAALIQQIVDHRVRDGLSLNGYKFQLTILIEGLAAVDRWVGGDRQIAGLADELKDVLRGFYRASGFCYFEEGYLPQDLDTSAAITRVLSADADVVRAYDALLERNRLGGEGLYPTWLDAPDWETWSCGSTPWHAETMLNSWLTQAHLGRDVDLRLVRWVVETAGLRNHWYVQRLFTPYLYYRVLRALRATSLPEMLLPVRAFLTSPPQPNTSFTDERHRTLIRQSQHVALDRLLTHLLTCAAFPAPRPPAPVLGEASDFDDVVVYWSLGHVPYRSVAVARAFTASLLGAFAPTVTSGWAAE